MGKTKDKNPMELCQHIVNNMENIIRDQSQENYNLKQENKWLKSILDKQFQILCLYFQGCKQTFKEDEDNAPNYYDMLCSLRKACKGVGISLETSQMLSTLDYIYNRDKAVAERNTNDK